MLVLVLLIAATFSPFPGVLAEDPVPYLNGATAFPRAKGLAAEQGPMASSAHGAGDGARALEVVIVMDYSSGDSRFTGMESLWSSIALPLASGGHDVTVLLVAGPEVDWAGFTFRSTARRYNGTGINIVQLPPNKHVTYSAPASVTLAYETYLWLGSRTGVDVIYFTDWGGLGYFTAAAKRQGLAFQDATIAVLLTGPRLWHAAHHGGQGGLGSLAGLESSFMERALVERADVAISSSQYMVSWFRRSGWQLPPLVYRVHPAPSRPAAAAATPDSPGGALPGEGDLPPFSEIVYFGPLEMRRGLAAFCDAVGRLIEEGARALGKHHQLQQPGRVHVAGVGAGDGSSPDGIHRYLANITFLGPDRPFLLDDGAGRVIRGRDYVMERAEGWKKLVDGTEWNIAVRFKGHLNASEALGYLAEDGEVRGHRRKLAVLPSPADSAGFGLAGVLHAGIPFLAYATGGAKELVADTDWERVLVPPSSRRLAERIIAALKDGHAPASTAQAAERGAVDAAWASWHARLAAHAEQLRGKSAIGAAFGGNREQVPGAATVGAQSTPGATGEAESGAFPTVSVVLVTFNRPWMVRQALQSILSQDYPGSLIDLVLVDDGSSDPEALALCRELEHEAAGLWFRERGWRLLRQPNGYLGAARNAGARAAVGDWILFMDDDNYAKVTEISTMVRAALRTGADIVTSLNDYLASSNTTHVPGEGDLVAKGRYIPLGGSIAVGVFNNEYGDANALIRAQALEELGGWAEDEAYGVQDWELFARAAVRGYRLEVVPEALYWYRVADGSMARELSQRINNRQLVMRPYVATGGALAELATFAQHLQIRERQLEDRLVLVTAPGAAGADATASQILLSLQQKHCSSANARVSAGFLKQPDFEWWKRDVDHVNPASEYFVDGWEGYEVGYNSSSGGRSRSVGRLHKEHSSCVHVSLTNPGEAGGAIQRAFVLQQVQEPLLLAGWSRVENIGGDGDAVDYSLYADITFADGTHQWAYFLPFDPHKEGWQLVYGVIEAPKLIHSVTVVTMFRWRTGAVEFDDVRLTRLEEGVCTLDLGGSFKPTEPEEEFGGEGGEGTNGGG